MGSLPRFRRGRAGGLSFSDLNELNSRVDRMRTTSQSDGIEGKPTESSKPVRALLVYARKSTASSSEGVARYDWEEAIVRGPYDDRPEDLPIDELVIPEVDADYEDLKANSQVRYGGFSADDYAVCTDESFESGFCFMMVMTRTDGTKRYVLVPSTAGGAGALVEINEFVSENTVASEGGSQLKVRTFTATPISFPVVMEDGSIGFDRGESASVLLYDFGANRVNRPSHNTGATLSVDEDNPLPDALGTVVFCQLTSATDENGDTVSLAFTAMLPRLKVECSG